MAIDPRISLAGTPAPNIGQRFGQTLQNLRNVDVINQQRDIAPIQLQEAQRVAELNTAQQPALLQQAEFAASGGTQLSNQQQQAQQIATSYATALRPLLNNPQALVTELQRQKVQFQNAGVDTSGIDEDIVQAQTPEGLALLGQEVNSALVPAGGASIQSSQFIPGVGFATLTKGGQAGVVPVEGVGETTAEKRQADIAGRASTEQLKATLSGKSSAVKAAVNKGAKAFDKIQTITTAISNYDEAISLLGPDGAETGVIDSLLPSFRKASIELDNVVKRLGLDVVGNTTFGALSESELKFALAAAIPTNLQPAELKEWLVAKRDAQKKVKERVEEAASFLSTGTHTLTDWIAFDQARQLNIKNQQSQTVTPPAVTPPAANAQQIGRFTVEVVN